MLKTYASPSATRPVPTRSRQLVRHGGEHRVPGELRGDDAEPDALRRRALHLVRRDGVEDVAVDEGVERLDRPRHRGVNLPTECAKHPGVELLVRDEDG